MQQQPGLTECQRATHDEQRDPNGENKRGEHDEGETELLRGRAEGRPDTTQSASKGRPQAEWASPEGGTGQAKVRLREKRSQCGCLAKCFLGQIELAVSQVLDSSCHQQPADSIQARCVALHPQPPDLSHGPARFDGVLRSVGLQVPGNERLEGRKGGRGLRNSTHVDDLLRPSRCRVQRGAREEERERSGDHRPHRADSLLFSTKAIRRSKSSPSSSADSCSVLLP